MKAIEISEFGGPEVLVYKEVPEPRLEAGQVKIRLVAAGINPVETYIRGGNYKDLPSLPYIPGSDGAGIIEALGAGVRGWQVGQRVYVSTAGRGTGTYAEKVVCDVAGVYPLPDQLSFEQGAALGTGGLTAVQALFQKAQIKPGERVLIHGATGGVGTLAVQLAKLTGAFVIGTAGSQSGLDLLEKLGADLAVFYQDVHDAEKWSKITQGQGLDVVIEMLANQNLPRDLALMAKEGRIVIVGNRGETMVDPRLIMNQEIQIMGMLLLKATPAQNKANSLRLNAALNHGVKPVIEQTFPLKEAQQAHERLLKARGSLGKIVLKMT